MSCPCFKAGSNNFQLKFEFGWKHDWLTHANVKTRFRTHNLFNTYAKLIKKERKNGLPVSGYYCLPRSGGGEQSEKAGDLWCQNMRDGGKVTMIHAHILATDTCTDNSSVVPDCSPPPHLSS